MKNRRMHTRTARTVCKLRFALMGPAFIAAIGYIDPGNFATNIQAGASFGYQLLWVVIWANLMAMIIQMLSAKLGIATGKNLAEQIRDRCPYPLVWFYWIQVELVAMATDMAEFIGAAIGFKLILNVSLLHGTILTGIATSFILKLECCGQKPLEKVIGGLLLFVAIAYIIELFFSQPNLSGLGIKIIVPNFPTSESVFLAAGILGATIMPHIIYLHSYLTQNLHEGNQKERYSATKWDVAIAMTIAGFVNLAMMAMAAAAFHFNGHTGVTDLDEAYLTLEPLLSHTAAKIFGLSLIASGLSSAVVGTLAGQVTMQGFVCFYIPLWLRRFITMLPSFIVVIIGMDPTRILVISQVFLSFGIALALIPLIVFTSDKSLMGELVNGSWVKRIGWVIVVLVITLNMWLLVCMALEIDNNHLFL